MNSLEVANDYSSFIDKLKAENEKLKLLWNQYCETRGTQVNGECFRAMDKLVNPDNYKKGE